MTNMMEKAQSELLVGQAVRKERTRCERIALSFLKDAKTEGEKYIVERIAEVIR